MYLDGKQILVVGDRVLIEPLDSDRTQQGLYLPVAAVEKMAVQTGRVVEVGPGIPVPSPSDVADEPWKMDRESATHYVPLEARVGDQALFLRSAAVEIELDRNKYVLVPHGAILLLTRERAGSNIPDALPDDEALGL